MKTISIFDVQDINTMLSNKNYDYILKLKDACGNLSLSLECTGKETDINELCEQINVVLKPKYVQVKPGTINPHYLQLY